MKFLLVVAIFAIVTYLAIRWMQEHGTDGSGGSGGSGGPGVPRLPRRPKPPTRPVAPDDDDAFLRDLEWKRRQAERRTPKKPNDPPPDQPSA